MLLPSQHKELTESYKQMYLGEVDEITEAIIEEVVEELIEECVEFGYELDEAANAVQEAATEYFDEAKITYGSDTESPEQRRARAQAKVGEKRSAARKAAVTGAVERVKTTASGVRTAAGIAGSIAKDEARRAGRSVQHKAEKAAQAVKDAPGKAKEAVKSGIRKLVGRGLRKAAGAAGYVAQKARKTGAAAGRAAERLGEERDLFDVILEYLVAEGFADTNKNALVIMANMSEEWREEILGQLDEEHKDLPTQKMKDRRFYVYHKTGEAAGSSRNEKIRQVLDAYKKDPEGEAAKARAKSKYKG